jgi:hypothetical protein
MKDRSHQISSNYIDTSQGTIYNHAPNIKIENNQWKKQQPLRKKDQGQLSTAELNEIDDKYLNRIAE